MGSRSHARHPHDPMRVPHRRDSGPAWGPYESREGVAGGQARSASDLTATAIDLLRLVVAGLALAGLTYGLGEIARGWM